MSTALKLQHLPALKLIVVSGPHTGEQFDLQKESISIGRDESNIVFLARDLRVSRTHAEIKWRDGAYHIINLSSRNFILIDGEKVDSAPLKNKSRMQIGETDFVIKIANMEGAESSTQLSIAQKQNSPPPMPTNVSTPAVQSKGERSPVTQKPRATGVSNVKTGNSAIANSATSQSRGGLTQTTPKAVSGAKAFEARRAAQRANQARQKSDPGKTRFYIILLIIAGVGVYLFSENSAKKTQPKPFRSHRQIEYEANMSAKSVEELRETSAKSDTIQQRRAQENLLKGLRDYQQGQYARARESFQVVLNLDPGNELASRYYQLSRLKFEELVKWNLMQGQRYREKKNWRLCKSNYFNVMVMLQNVKEDPMYREAKQFHEECALQAEGRY